MKQFIDQNGCEVKLVFGDRSLFEKGAHVWIVCRYESKWLLTKHRERGLEFPGGKVELGEDEESAARREVYEETGGVAGALTYIGQYEVECKEKVLQKKIYFTEVTNIEKKLHYYETSGPMLIDDFPAEIVNDSSFSFIMKDELLPNVLHQIKIRKLIR